MQRNLDILFLGVITQVWAESGGQQTVWAIPLGSLNMAMQCVAHLGPFSDAGDTLKNCHEAVPNVGKPTGINGTFSDGSAMRGDRPVVLSGSPSRQAILPPATKYPLLLVFIFFAFLKAWFSRVSSGGGPNCLAESTWHNSQNSHGLRIPFTSVKRQTP